MKDKKGFTLVEVIISIAALGIICAVLMRLFVVAGNTNNKAGDMQSAGLCVTTTIETLAAADTLNEALSKLGITAHESITNENFSLVRDGYDLTITVQKKGEYPGTLYDVTVSALKEGKVVCSIDTAKYYKEQADD